MLDQESQSRRESFESVGRSGAESRESLGRWGLEGDEGSASATSSPSLGSVEAFEGPTKRSRATSSATRKGDTLPRLATVTTAGGTSSPLLIFTGSPNPSPSLSTSSRTFQSAPGRSPSPSHTAYNLPSSRSTTPSRSSSSHVTSQPMDRTSSSSKSRELHGRQISLTSACAPVTSSYVASPEVQQSGFSTVVGNGSSDPQRGWKVYDWGAREKGRSDSSDDEDPRIGAKGALQQPSALASFLNLPSALLAFFLTPLSSTVGTHHSPRLNASTAPTDKSQQKRYPLFVRLLTVAYLVFSALFFGLHMSSWASGNDPSGASKYLRGRLGPRGADGALLSEGFEDGSAFMAGGVGQWAQKVADGVRWSRGGGGNVDGEGSADALALTSASTNEWGLVRRLGSQGECSFASIADQFADLCSIS